MDGFNDLEETQNQLDAWMDRFKSSQALPNSEVLIPGEPELKMQNERLENGIPIGSEVWQDLMNISKELNVKL